MRVELPGSDFAIFGERETAFAEGVALVSAARITTVTRTAFIVCFNFPPNLVLANLVARNILCDLDAEARHIVPKDAGCFYDGNAAGEGERWPEEDHEGHRRHEQT